MAIRLNYSPPPDGLREAVSSMYDLACDDDHYDQLERSDRPQLRLHSSLKRGDYHFADGHCAPVQVFSILGPTSGPLRGVGPAPMIVTGVGLLPDAWVALLGKRAAELADRVIDGAELWGAARVEALRSQVAAIDDPFQRMAALGAFLAQEPALAHCTRSRFCTLVDDWLASSDDPAIGDLLAATALSQRQVERLVRRHYGLSPKLLARKYRALKFAAALARGESLADLTLDGGFYDQSHLIREIRAFVGLTPGQIEGKEGAFTRAIALGRKALSGKVDRLVSDA